MKQGLSPQSGPQPAIAPVHFGRQPIAGLRVLWRFARPHTIIGTSLSVLGLFGLAWAPDAGPSPGALGLGLLAAWLACLCGNVYIVGLNQIEDVAIDRVNKPQLPLAAGTLSRPQAIAIVAGTGLLALLIASTQGWGLLATIAISLLIGTAYSLPPIRLKRFPFWASFCILAVRGGVVNLGLFGHYQAHLWGGDGAIPPRIWALTGFILLFSIAIAIFKDIPDLEGDRQYQIQTFTVRLGQRAVFRLARWVLTLAYSGMIGVALVLPDMHRTLVILSHAIALAACWVYSRRVNLAPTSPTAAPFTAAPLTSALSYPQFYQFIWILFFAEYLMFPIAHLLG